MMPEPKPTGYGWLIRLPDDALQECATYREAVEAWQEAANEQELI